VGFDPDDGQEYLGGADYPASKATLLSAAEDNGAPGELIEMIEGLPLGEFTDLDEFMTTLGPCPTGTIDRSRGIPRDRRRSY
jgi:hypothetical protein